MRHGVDVVLELGVLSRELGLDPAALGDVVEYEHLARVHALGQDETAPRNADPDDGLVLAAGAGETRVAAVAAVRRDGTDWLVERAYAGARTRDPAAASAGRVVASGTVAAELAAEGPIARLAVRGTARGARVRYDDVAIARLGARFSAVVADRQLRGRSHVDASGVVNAGTPIGAVSLDVRNRRDRRLDVTARLRAAAAPVVVDATAVVTPGDVIAVALGHHTVRTASGRWSGAGGTIHIDDQRVLVRGVRSALDGDRAARVTVDATLGRGTGALDLHAAATAVPAAALDPSLRGVADASLAITRRRARWAGHGELHATALVLAPDTPPVDAALALAVDGRHVTLEGSASNAQIGRAHVTLAVDGPRDLTDVQAWQRVARADLRAITLGLEHVDAAALTNGRAGGTVDATLEIRDGTPSGALTIRGVPTPAGAADANVTLALSDTGLVDARARAHVGALGATTADARLRIPDRPFDVTAWRLLGARVVDDARVATEEIAIDPGLLAGLGIDAPYRGKARVAATLGAGATAAHVTVDVRELRGGALVRGVDVHAEAHADTASTTASLRVAAGERVLVTLTGARLPVSLDRWLVAPTTAWSAPLGGRLTVPRGTLRDVLALVGRDEVAQGTLEGTLDLGGTLGTPTANGTVDLLAVRVRPRVGARPPPALSSLHVDATWGGDRGRLQITGVEASRGTLLVDVTGRPDQLASVLGTVKIERFDLAPISVFLPGPLVAAHGRLDADLAMRGLDPTVGSLRGTVHLTDGRLPLSPRLGTLRRAEVTVAIDDTGITGTLTGRIGGGTVTLAARSGRDLGTTTFTGQVSKLSPIAARQPVIDGQLAGTLRRDGLRWTGEATIARASVLVPAARGNELLDEAVPEDVFFVDLPVPAPRRGPRAPERPWLVLDVTLQPTRIVVPIITADVWARGKVQVAVGDTVGLDGEVRVERGTLDVLGHRYRVDDGQLTFDGTTDALVDVKLAHAFPDLTLYARYAGRVSELGSVEPELTSDPGTYTRGQLLGFFLGGAPGGDPSQQATEAAANVLAALGSTSVGRTLKKLIPLDVIRCDPGAGLEGASCTGGRWITPKAYVSYRQKLEARQDENTGDASLEYYWRPDRVFELMGGDRGYFGLDLMVRRRW